MQLLHSSRRARRRSLSLAIATSLGLVAGAAFAQSTVGGVYGTPDAGAQFTGENRGSGLSRGATAGSDGRFNISSLPAGDYKITSTQGGKSTTRDIHVVAG